MAGYLCPMPIGILFSLNIFTIMKKNRQLKRVLATLAALLLLMPMTAGAETINTVTSSENLTKTSTVYVGEVVVDGVTQIKYIYSGDMTQSSVVKQNLLEFLILFILPPIP